MRLPEKAFSRRLYILVFFFCVWALLIVVQLVRYTIVERSALRKESSRLAWREGSIPVVRGRIFDASGTLLVWSNLMTDLVLTRMPENEKVFLRMQEALRSVADITIEKERKTPVVLAADVAPDFFKKVEPLCRQYPELRLLTRQVRRHVEYPGVREAAAAWEKQYDSTLAGRPGRFRVMQDRRGIWLADTLRIELDPLYGEDVQLPQTLKEILDSGEAHHVPAE